MTNRKRCSRVRGRRNLSLLPIIARPTADAWPAVGAHWPGRARTRRATLTRAVALVPPGPAAAKTGYLRINSKPWTRILIDGRDTGLTTPQTKISLPAGKHTVLLVNNPFNIKHTFTIAIAAGETLTKVLDLRNPEQGAE